MSAGASTLKDESISFGEPAPRKPDRLKAMCQRQIHLSTIVVPISDEQAELRLARVLAIPPYVKGWALDQPSIKKPLSDLRRHYVDRDNTSWFVLKTWAGRKVSTGPGMHREEILERRKFHKGPASGPTWVWNPLRSMALHLKFMAQAAQPSDLTKQSSPLLQQQAPDDGDVDRKVAGYAHQTEEAQVEKLPVEYDAHDDDETGALVRFTSGHHVIERGPRDKTPEARNAQENLRAYFESLLRQGHGWSASNPPEYTDTLTLKDGQTVKINYRNELILQIQYWIRLDEPGYATQQELAKDLRAELGPTLAALERFNTRKEWPKTPFSAQQIRNLIQSQGYAVFGHVTTDRSRWYELDMEACGTYKEALIQCREKAVMRRLRDEPQFNNPKAGKVRFTQSLREVRDYFEKAFDPLVVYIADWRSPLVVAIAEAAAEV